MAKGARGAIEPADEELALKKCSPSDTQGLDEETARELLHKDVERLAELHDLLYATRSHALLVVLQGMDTSGKDGTVRHVLQGFSPLGTAVHSFKQPTAEELAHDFLWRVHKVVPGRGTVGIFNRSHYEDVLVTRVHGLIGSGEAHERMRAIRQFERHLAAEGVLVRKFFLHISAEEQAKRIEERVRDPRKRWKYNEGDLVERKAWDAYQDAYEDAIRRTSTRHSPWYVIPSDHKWYRNLAVARVLVETLEGIKLHWPEPEVPSVKTVAKELEED